MCSVPTSLLDRSTPHQRPVASIPVGEGLGDGSPTISEMVGSFFLQENDSLCVHTHSASTNSRRYNRNLRLGMGSPSSLGG